MESERPSQFLVSSRTLCVLLFSCPLTTGTGAVFCATWINSARLRQSQGRVSKVAITAGPFVVTAIWATRQHIRDIREARNSKGRAGMRCCRGGSGTVWLGFYRQNKILQHGFIGPKPPVQLSRWNIYLMSSYLPLTEVTFSTETSSVSFFPILWTWKCCSAKCEHRKLLGMQLSVG